MRGRRARWLAPTLLPVFTAILVTQLVQNNVTDHRRVSDDYRSKEVCAVITALERVKISKRTSGVLQELKSRLEEVDFSYSEDRVIAVADMPGIISGLGVKALGPPWPITGYPQSKAYYCSVMRRTESTRPGELTRCLTLRPLSEYSEYDAGQFFHTRYGSNVEIRLVGPFAWHSIN